MSELADGKQINHLNNLTIKDCLPETMLLKISRTVKSHTETTSKIENRRLTKQNKDQLK